MAKGKISKKKEAKEEVLKIPVTLEGFAFNKRTQDWGVSFAMQPENLEYGKPLMNHMGDHFVLVLVKVESMDSLREALKNDDLEGVKI